MLQSTASRVIAIVITIVVVIVLFFVFQGEDEANHDDSPPPAATTDATGGSGTADEPGGKDEPAERDRPSPPTIVVRDGAPRDGVAELTFSKGERIRFVVRSDAADEVHVHGYDIEKELPAGGAARFDFPAEIDGVFEVELHSDATPIAELIVNP